MTEKDLLERIEASELGERILEWTRELNYLRAKCRNLNSPIAGRMKKNIAKIQEGTSMLVSRVMVTGDPVFLRMRHREMSLRVRELERENERMRELEQENGRLRDGLRRVSPRNDPLPSSGGHQGEMRSVAMTAGNIREEII